MEGKSSEKETEKKVIHSHNILDKTMFTHEFCRSDRLEKLSASNLSLSELKAFFECKKMWQDFSRAKKLLIAGITLEDKELNVCTTMLAIRILYQSFQRPGAIINCTLQEYRERKELEEGGKKCIVISVKEHKTGVSG